MKSVAITLSLNKHFDRKVAEGIRRYLRQSQGWSIYLEDEPESNVSNLQDQSFDGVIAELDDPQIPRLLAGLKIPIVGIGGIKDRYAKKLPISTVETDNRRIAQLAAEHLLQCRVTHFAYCGVRSRTVDPWTLQREQAFVQFLKEHGFHCDVFREQAAHAQRWRTLRAALVAWIEALPKPLGVFAANDSRARHVLEACVALSVQVPDEVAVIGVDNDELFCSLTHPPLSSVIQGTEEIGYQAARLLDLTMRGRIRKPRHLIIPPVGIAMRGSTDVIASNDAIVAAAIRFIRKEAMSRTHATDVARHLDVSRSTLDLHFKQVVGRSVRQEIQRVQLNRVTELLVTTDLTLDEIAQQAGYSSPQYLTAVFRREFGQTPGQYRRAAR